MNRKELVSALSAQTGLSRSDANVVVSKLFGILLSTLANGEECQIHGFGTFSIQHRAAHYGVHPQSGKPIQFPAQKVVRFTSSSTLKKSLNK